MKKIDLMNVSLWIHRNARELELNLFKYHFEGGNKLDVVDSLRLYQNEDGGFGHKVEPDNWNPNSVPYATSYVIEMLLSIDFLDFNHPVYKGIFHYLDQKNFFTDVAKFTIPSNEEFAHAPWFNYNEEYNKVESNGLKAIFASFIIKYYSESTNYQAALDFSKELIGKMDGSLGDMGPSGLIVLVKALKDSSVEGFDYEVLQRKIYDLVYTSIQRDSKVWSMYGYRPSDYIKSKESPFYQGNEEIVEEELNYLIDTRSDGDVWPITWSWFDNDQKYHDEFVLSQNWYKAIKAIERMIFLKNFGRI